MSSNEEQNVESIFRKRHEIIGDRASVVSLIGALLVVISAFLPWYWTKITWPSPLTGTHSSFVLGLGTGLTGWMIFLFGLARVGNEITKKGLVRARYRVLLSVLILLAVFYDFSNLTYSLFAPSEMVSFQPQFGIYIAVVGSLILIVGEIMLLREAKTKSS